MGDFRKVVIALAALLMFVGLASAQTAFQCTASASVPPTIRTEGYTEQVGDIVLSCFGGTLTVPAAGAANLAVSPSQLANVTVFTTAPITSRLMSTADNRSEALLMIDEPATGSQTLCSTISGATTCSSPTTITSAGAVAGSNVFPGVVSGQSVTFFGVPILPPATAGGSRIYRVTNIRVSAGSTGGSGGFPGSVTAAVSINGAQAVPLNNPNQVVAYGQAGLVTALRNATNGGSASTPVGLAQCTSQGADQTASANRLTSSNGVYLRFTENFGNAFKTRYAGSTLTTVGISPTAQNVPGQVANNSESGFVLPSYSNAPYIAGLADSGTRLKAVFNNVPNGVRLYVSYTNTATQAPVSTTAASYAQLVATTAGGEAVSDYSGLPPVAPVSGDFIGSSAQTVELPVVNGQAVAVWEIVSSQPFVIENFDFAMAVRYAASTATNSPAPGTFTVNQSFAPSANLAATTAASVNAPIPRFADTSTATRLFQISPCRTVLLFPYVANVQGLDTGIAIANTSTDPFGTTPQSGTCVINAYGTNAPTQAINTASVASGSYTTVLASSQLPGFVGYMIATCNFQFAHGFAFISDLGIRNLAMGYLALVIPDPGTGGGGRSPNGFTSTSTNEILGY